jgi:hypothetical protein
MDIGYITSRPTYLTTIAWDESTQANTFIGVIPVSPCISARRVSSTDWAYDTTPSSFVASLFKYWSGSMRYRFEIVSTNFHAGRLIFCYFPRLATTDAIEVDQIANAWSIILDISEGNEVSFEVPYLSEYPALPCVLDDVDFNYVRSRFAGQAQDALAQIFNGAVGIGVLSPLIRADTVDSQIEINVWVSCGSDMEFLMPNTGAYMAGFPTATDGSLPTTGRGFPTPPTLFSALEESQDVIAKAQSNYFQGVASGSFQEAEGFDRGSEEQLIPMRVEKCDASALIGGERIKSLRQVIKRMGFAQRVVTENGQLVLIDPAYFRAVDMTIPGKGILAPLSSLNDYRGQSLISYISTMYAGFRGSRRYLVHSTSTLMNVSMSNLTYTALVPSVPKAITQTDPINRNGTDNTANCEGLGHISTHGPFLQLSSGDTRMIEFDVPQTSRMPWQILGALFMSRLPIPVERQPILVGNSFQTAATYDIFESAADDFTFGLLVGGPIVRRVGYSFVLNVGSNAFSL